MKEPVPGTARAGMNVTWSQPSKSIHGGGSLGNGQKPHRAVPGALDPQERPLIQHREKRLRGESDACAES